MVKLSSALYVETAGEAANRGNAGLLPTHRLYRRVNSCAQVLGYHTQGLPGHFGSKVAGDPYIAFSCNQWNSA